MNSLENVAKLQQILENNLKGSFFLSKNYVQKSHIDFMSKFILALMSAKDVQYHAVASEMSGDALESSKVRRIQRFMADFDLDYLCVAQFMLDLLPPKGKITFCLDRTEWSFGKTTHNILVLTAYSHGVGVPIWFESVNENGGCCDVDDKIYMILSCLELVDKSRIKCLIADSEFIGHQWIDFLMKEGIIFYLDVRSNQYFTYKAQCCQIGSFMKGKYKEELPEVNLFNHNLRLGIKRQKQDAKKKRKPFLAVITNSPKAGVLNVYKNRWSIEVLFQSFKQRGFKIESTHLQDAVRMRKLFALVSMAFILALQTGILVDKHKPITIKNHGYKENSYFRKGKDFLANLDKSKGKIKNKIEQKIKDFEIIFQNLCEMLINILNKPKKWYLIPI